MRQSRPSSIGTPAPLTNFTTTGGKSVDKKPLSLMEMLQMFEFGRFYDFTIVFDATLTPSTGLFS
jgi:hypothetical protein